MSMPISPPAEFNTQAYGARWFTWAEMEACFWPGKGNRSESVHAELAKIMNLGGVYLLAWSPTPPASVSPACSQVQYIGQTHLFRNRMGQFGASAGFWGKRDRGHSAGWRWPEGHKRDLCVAFFPVGNELPHHLAEGLRHWVEALAIEAHHQAHARLPLVNGSRSVVAFSNA